MLRRLLPVLAFAAAVAVAVALVPVLRGPAGTRITAYFPLAIGVYAGSEVRVLGVKTGTIDSVRPEGTRVKVALTVDHGVRIPADARAVVIAPSLVSDRYIQLVPAYTGGPVMPSGAVVPQERTAAPVELDQLYDSMKRLATALGPDGANRDGAVSRALEAGAENLEGNGTDVRRLIDDFAQASKTLSTSKDDLFGAIGDLNEFTSMLAANDGQVRKAERQLAAVSGFLAEDRDELAAALTHLTRAMVEVRSFIKDNRALVRQDVERLEKITKVLVRQRAALAEALDTLPLTVQNVLNAYDPATRSLRGRGNVLELMPLGEVR
ncbi:MCE family protein [Actinocorallia sp. B10E7]|uniref:MCE family protein n=1 Tax=Actinocorallia sp. B10E7 TaxID=3153558 RepID=UPI00325EC658